MARIEMIIIFNHHVSVQEMEFAHSLRQNKVKIKICQVTSCSS
jgi:hypothetical protein